MSYRKRFQGADIPRGYSVAVEHVAGGRAEVVGYASSEEDADEFIRRSSDGQSHVGFFQKKYGAGQQMFGAARPEAVLEDSPAEARQSMRRIEAFQSMFERLAIDRVSPGSGPDLLYVTFEEAQRMQSEYKDALRQGEAAAFPFQPLSAYAHKLVSMRKDGTIRKVRDVLVNEWGVWTDRSGRARIVVLKDQGPGDVGGKYFQVPGEEK